MCARVWSRALSGVTLFWRLVEMRRGLLLLFGTSLVVFGGQYLVSAGNLQNSQCVTSLNPAECGGIGNSYCNANATPCGGSCFSCSSTIGLPQKYCAAKKGSTCNENGQAAINCGYGVPRMSGTCTKVGTCICNNPVQTGTCGNTFTFDCT